MPDSKSLSQSRYNRFAQGYVESQTHAKGADLDRLVSLAGLDEPQPEWLALDVATGGGHTALRLHGLVRQVIAADLTPNILTAARAHLRQKGAAGVRFVQSDAERLPFAPGRFDLITCRIAAHHFPDAAAFVRSAANSLRPGGRLVVQDHLLPEDAAAGRAIDDFERLRDPSHHRAFSQSEWIALFEAAGLQVEAIETVTKQHSFLDWARRQDCSDETIAELLRRLKQAGPNMRQWLDPQRLDDLAQTSFTNQHILIAGRKPPSA